MVSVMEPPQTVRPQTLPEPLGSAANQTEKLSVMIDVREVVPGVHLQHQAKRLRTAFCVLANALQFLPIDVLPDEEIVLAKVAEHFDIRLADMQLIVNSAPTAGEGARLRRCLSAMVTAGIAAGYLTSPRLKDVHWQAAQVRMS